MFFLSDRKILSDCKILSGFSNVNQSAFTWDTIGNWLLVRVFGVGKQDLMDFLVRAVIDFDIV